MRSVMRHRRYVRSEGERVVKRRPGRSGGKKGLGNDLGGSLVEYVLVLSLVAVVAAGALVYLGSAVSHTANKISAAVTTDPPSVTIDPPAPVFQPTVMPTPGARCGVDTNGTTLSGLCSGAAGYTWLVGMVYYPPPNGPWTSITAANDGLIFSQATQTAPAAWTCIATTKNHKFCTEIQTPVGAGNVPVAYSLGTT
jgi:Flp pilus assembly pilin Flp